MFLHSILSKLMFCVYIFMVLCSESIFQSEVCFVCQVFFGQKCFATPSIFQAEVRLLNLISSM